MGLYTTTEQGAAPSTPASGSVTLYAKTDGIWYWKDDSGNEHALIGNDSTQTLTNKTLTSPTIQGTVGAGTGLTLPALVLSGNVTSTGNPSLNIGSGALTAGATSVTTLTASGAISTSGGNILNAYASADGGTVTHSVNNTNTNAASIASYRMITGASANIWHMFARNNSIFWGIDSVADYMQLSSTGLAVTGAVTPSADNTYDLGSASLGWKEIFADNGTINTSDARRKTAVRSLADAEIAAAKDLSKEIGAFQFLAAVAEKGDSARLHIGMTVQRAIEVMQSHGLDPFRYSFICYDEWDDEYQDIPAVEARSATPEQPAQYESREVRETVIIDGEEREIVRTELVEISPRVPAQEAIEAKPAERKLIRAGGNKYGFRVHELLLFIARGIESRLTALEA